MQTLANCLGKNYNSGKHHYEHFLTQNSEMNEMHFLGKRQKYRKYYLQRKNYKENVENISMNKSGKIKKRENIFCGVNRK